MFLAIFKRTGFIHFVALYYAHARKTLRSSSSSQTADRDVSRKRQSAGFPAAVTGGSGELGLSGDDSERLYVVGRSFFCKFPREISRPSVSNSLNVASLF